MQLHPELALDIASLQKAPLGYSAFSDAVAVLILDICRTMIADRDTAPAPFCGDAISIGDCAPSFSSNGRPRLALVLQVNIARDLEPPFRRNMALFPGVTVGELDVYESFDNWGECNVAFDASHWLSVRACLLIEALARTDAQWHDRNEQKDVCFALLQDSLKRDCPGITLDTLGQLHAAGIISRNDSGAVAQLLSHGNSGLLTLHPVITPPDLTF